MRIAGTDAFDKWQGYGADFKARRIILDDGIDDIGTTNACVANLLWMDRSPGPIEFWINCPGGWVTSMWAIYDLIRTADNPIITVGIGDVSSAAVLLLAAGTGTRYVMPNCTVMHHQAQHQRAANQAELEAYTAASKIDEEVRLRRLAEHTKTPYRVWRAKGAAEWYMRGTEIIQAGIADELWTGPLEDES